jgi:hypothetical protein
MRKVGEGDCYYVGVATNESGRSSVEGIFLMTNTTSPKDIVFEITGNLQVNAIRFGYFDQPKGTIPLSSLVDPGLSKVVAFSPVNNVVTAKNCYPFGKGFYSRSTMNENGTEFVRYSAYDASSCESMHLGTSAILAAGGSISLETRNINGRPIKFCLRHDLPGDCLVEEIVPSGVKDEWVTTTYPILPVTNYGDLYLELDDYAVGKEERVNDVGKIEIRSRVEQDNNESIQPGTFYSNNQAYRKGWLGIDADTGTILKHVKVDGWANGWMVPGSVTIAIFYWPQLLEYLGFALLVAMILVIVFKRK